MEYEFITDPVTGLASARFSLDHEVVGPWLEVEVGNNQDKLTELLTAIDEIASGKVKEKTIAGQEYSVVIDTDDVTFCNNSMLNGTSAPIPEEILEQFDNLDMISSSQCGLEDLRTLLLSWSKFTR